MRGRSATVAQLAAALVALASWTQALFAEPIMRERAPPLSIETVNGQDFDLDAMGGKVVLVTFWATWCGPCLAEMPAIATFYRKHRAQGLEVIALSIDRPGDRAKMLRLLAKLPFPGALLSEASRNGFGTPDGVPISYVVDKRGIVRDKFIAIDAELLDEVVLPLISEASVQPIGARGPQ
jgi:cytochrome c biogenesis protein CcmG, thiol:disulfide interchange protein DsbE